MFSRILHCWQNMWVYITALPYSYVELKCSKYEKYGKISKLTHKHSNWQKHKNQFTNNNQPTVNSKQQKTNNKQQQKFKKQQQINIYAKDIVYITLNLCALVWWFSYMGSIWHIWPILQSFVPVALVVEGGWVILFKHSFLISENKLHWLTHAILF